MPSSASPPDAFLTGEVGFYTRRDPDTVRGADVVFISTERYGRRTRTPTFLDVAPELVVEVLSVQDTVMDLTDKLREYFAAGGEARVGRRSAGAQRVRLPVPHRSAATGRTDTLSGEEVLHGFTARVTALFEE